MSATLTKVQPALNGRVISGMWKFHQSVGVDALFELATEWFKAGSDNYLSLHVRPCSKDQIGIGFMCALKPDETMQTFKARITDQLKRRFGNDYVGWDIACPTYVICQWQMPTDTNTK